MIRRLFGLLALAAGGLAAVVIVELIALSRREYLPTDPGYTVDERIEPTSGDVSGGALRIAVLGDSTVAGVGSPTALESLPALIAARLADRAGRPVEVTGFGISGARTADVAVDQLPRVDGPFDALVIVVGSNDATHATPWGDVRRSTEELLRQAADRGAPVVLAGTPRFSGNQIIPEPLKTALDRYAGVLRGEQRKAVDAVPGTSFVDIAADASPRFVGRPEATSSDGFHPSPIGYGFWADAITPVLADAIAGD